MEKTSTPAEELAVSHPQILPYRKVPQLLQENLKIDF
jgi:hypothetical protein